MRGFDNGYSVAFQSSLARCQCVVLPSTNVDAGVTTAAYNSPQPGPGVGSPWPVESLNRFRRGQHSIRLLHPAVPAVRQEVAQGRVNMVTTVVKSCRVPSWNRCTCGHLPVCYTGTPLEVPIELSVVRKMGGGRYRNESCLPGARASATPLAGANS
jgi:hypothetical protein